MPGTSVIGLQWGDEAKGKLVDLLTSRFEIVPLGNSQPLSPRAGLDPARANRSVAFRVSLRPLTREIP